MRKSKADKKPITELTLTEPVGEDTPTRAVIDERRLTHIRARALHHQTETQHTITELEAWRAEIEATISFLKGRTK